MRGNWETSSGKSGLNCRTLRRDWLLKGMLSEGRPSRRTLPRSSIRPSHDSGGVPTNYQAPSLGYRRAKMKDTRAKKISLPGNQFLRGAGVLSFLLVLVFTAGKTARLSAQGTETGSIVGTVIDPAKAVVPQADVSVANEATGVERSAKTNGAGLY